MKFKQESLQLLRYDPLLSKFTVCQQALKLLAGLDRPLSVISVAGAYRTGKSYLLNELLLRRPKAFQVGDTMNAQTKGLWLWSKPIPAKDEQGNPFYHIVVDSEGIGSTDQDFSHDCKLLLLIFYLSSTLIYNSLGVIDQNALNNFREILEIQKHLGGKKEEESMPSFVWILRDFALELVDREGQPLTENEYLQLSLQETEATTELQLRKNNIRRAIKQFFRERHCFTMVRPILDEIKLQQLSNQSRQSLRPDFVDKMDDIRKQIFGRIARKKLYEGVEITGPVLCRMIEGYVARINESTYPVVSNLWSVVCASTNSDLCDRLVTEMEERVRALKLPQDSETLGSTLREMEGQVLQEFQAGAFKNKQYYELLEDVRTRAKKLRKLVRRKNDAINAELNLQETELLFNKNVRPKLKEDFSGFREAMSTFINSIKQITPREKLLVDRFRELILWLDGRRLNELEQKEIAHQEMARLNIQIAGLRELQGVKEKHGDLERRLSDKVEEVLALRDKLAEQQEESRGLQVELKKRIELYNQQTSFFADKEQEYRDTIASLNEENKRLLDELNKRTGNGEQSDKLLQSCFDKFESQRSWWKEREEVLKKTIGDISSRLGETEASLKQQTERAMKQKKAYQEKERFFQEQVRELKKTMTETKSSYQKTSETLTRNGNLLRAIENMKNNQNDRSATKERKVLAQTRQNQQNILSLKRAQMELSQTKSELRAASHKIESLETQLTEKTRLFDKQLEVERSAKASQLVDQNKDLLAKCRVLQLEIEKLQAERACSSQKIEAAVQNLTKARNRDRTLYEQSIRKLLQNINRKENQATRPDY